MNKINMFLDKKIKLKKFDGNNENLGNFPKDGSYPIVLLNDVLKDVRKTSKETSSLADEIKLARTLKNKLNDLSKSLNLDSNHFQIDCSGETYVVNYKNGQHYISPTHFENGAYFSSPHFDHELLNSDIDVPRIHIGKYTRFGKGASVNVGADVFIGNYVWLAPGSILLRQEHNAYGQPSIGARTVSMTKQPPIYVSDYAWIGRDAIVGWNAGYIGKASIVGARSFINKWVGDYSIVGDHSRILGYLPYKAYFMEYYNPSLEEILQISDWENIYQEWQKYFLSKINSFKEAFVPGLSHILLNKQLSAKGKVLVVNPDSPKIFEGLASSNRIDVLVTDAKLVPFILEVAQRTSFRNVRVRVISEQSEFPLESNQKKFGKEDGYDLVLTDSTSKNVVSECKRVIKSTGVIVNNGHRFVKNISISPTEKTNN